MKLLFVLHGFPPRDCRGTELYTLHLIRTLRIRHEVHVFYAEHDFGKPEYQVSRGEYEGISFTAVNQTQLFTRSLSDTYRDRRIEVVFENLLDEIRPDTVHIQHLSTLSAGLPQLAHHRNCSVVMTLHDYWMICPQGQMLRRDLKTCRQPVLKECTACRIRHVSRDEFTLKTLKLLEIFLAANTRFAGLQQFVSWLCGGFRRLACARNPEAFGEIQARENVFRAMSRYVDFFISPSRTLQNAFRSWGVPAEKMIHLPNGYNADGFDSTSKNPAVRMRFGFLGSLTPAKGVHQMLRAAVSIPAQDAEFHFYGGFRLYEGFLGYEETFRKFERSRNLFFHGEYHPSETPEILRNLDVLVLPSLWSENAPLTIQEALLSATPVLCADQGGMAEMIQNGKSGLLFKPASVRALKHAMQRLIRDRRLYAEMREFLQRARENFRTGSLNKAQSQAAFSFETMDAHAGRIEEIYRLARRSEPDFIPRL